MAQQETKQEVNKMQLVEQDIISHKDPRFAVIDAAAFKSKNLYNAGNYKYWQGFIHEGQYLTYNEVQKRMQSHEAYKSPSSESQSADFAGAGQQLEGLSRRAQSVNEDSSKFLERPPKYKHKQAMHTQTCRQLSSENGQP